MDEWMDGYVWTDIWNYGLFMDILNECYFMDEESLHVKFAPTVSVSYMCLSYCCSSDRGIYRSKAVITVRCFLISIGEEDTATLLYVLVSKPVTFLCFDRILI